MTSVSQLPIARAPRNIRRGERPTSKLLKTASGTRLHVHAGESTTPTLGSPEEVITYLERFVDLLNSDIKDASLQSVVLLLCANLKAYGYQLEKVYKDQLDRAFVYLRNALRGSDLDELSRIHLLEVIELRSSKWMPNESWSLYYQQKSSQAELLESQVDTIPATSQALSNTQISITPSTSVTQIPNSASPPPPQPSLLLPGELVKPSGKYPQATRIPGKNLFKDEVVIRNADSGKVMGIKGRRVHLIEEISETVISFQRVAAGTKERLVQITGPTEDSIERARTLIEDTIRRNASPVRPVGMEGIQVGSSSSLDTLGDDNTGAQARNAQGQNQKLARSVSMLDAALGEYKYTVTVGDSYLKITGNNLDNVRIAKLILDEYFSRDTERAASPSNSLDDGLGSGSNFSGSPREPTLSGKTHFTAEAPPVSLPSIPGSVECNLSRVQLRFYRRENLLLYSTSPICKQVPLNWSKIQDVAPEILRKEPKIFNADAYFEQYRLGYEAEWIVIAPESESEVVN